MAEVAATSAFLQVVFQIAANFVVEELTAAPADNNLQQELQDLKNNVHMIDLTLSEAGKINPSPLLKRWLDELRDVGYEAIDLLDEHSTELLRRKLVHCPEMRNWLSDHSHANFKRKHYEHGMSLKIKEVTLKMSQVLKTRSDYGLNVNESPSVCDRVENTSSLLPTHVVVGREDEKRQILKMLLPYGDIQVGEPKLLILAIYGMGRIGKTTLSQLIYNDEKIKEQFDMSLWIHVSYEFDLEKLTRSILDSMNVPSCASSNLDTHQRSIQEKLQGKRYFLVLDDLWNENRHDWDKLIRPLYVGAPRSVIIVTTRNELVANMVTTILPFELKQLSEHGCYSLVKQYASRNGEHDCPKLYALRSEIFEKTGGMPEEAINLGDQLHQEHNKEKWDKIIEKWSEEHILTEERNRIIESMKMSYSRLPSHLKPCLAYCSIIPKNLLFEKERIVQLWTAQNFIAKDNERKIEDIGCTYFDSLVKRSFFHIKTIDIYRDRTEYNIHDAVHKLLRHVSSDECCIFEPDKSHNLNETPRHMSIILKSEFLSSMEDPFSKIYHCKGLYTLLVIGGFTVSYPLTLPDDLFDNLVRLRSLDLSYWNLSSLPNNIKNLKHLRYLQLRNTKIQELPESISNLYNLQTLGLRNCFLLRKLPNETSCLRKLRHLDLHVDNNLHANAQRRETLEAMPPKIGLLTDLQVLSRFVVSTRRHCGMNELKNLNSLQGELSISNLDLVKNPRDAEEANLLEKRHIKKLEFIWSGDGSHKGSKERTTTKEVLENMRPSRSIEELNIVGYNGEIPPSWLISGYLSNLRAIYLSNWTNCIMLPTLGNLPLLQDLHIEGWHSLKSVDCKLCGNDQTHFPSLKKLVFENMASVERWSANERCELPYLRELVLKNCPYLQRLTHNFPSLTKLMIENLPAFIGLRRFPSLEYLEVVACDNWIWDSWRCLSSIFSLTLSQLSLETLPAGLPILDRLRRLEISHCPNLIMFPADWIPSGLTSLCIRQCPLLRELPKGLETLKSLEDLEIQDCKNLKFLPEIKHLKVLTRLVISGCHSFEYLPRQGLPDALHFLSISGCPLFSSQLKNLQSPDRKKIKHVFSVWIDQIHLSSASNRTQGESSTSRR